MEEESILKNKTLITVLVIATIIIYVAIFIIIEQDDSEKSKLSAKTVTNYSEFYTVSSCANKYIDLIASRDADSLINVLSENYKKKNHITSSNILDSIPSVDGDSTFSANKMYYEKLDNDTYKYYIAGFLETGGLEMTDRRRVTSYLIVYLDKENTLFSIEPYDGKEFIEKVFT